MYKFLALVCIYPFILFKYYENYPKITNVKIYKKIKTITHTLDSQQLISLDNEEYEKLFGKYSYITNIYITNVGKIAVTENIEKTNKNKYILWLNGSCETFCHPFVSEKIIDKGYDIYAIDFPNIGFAQSKNKSIFDYPNIPELIGILNTIIKFIDLNYKEPTRVLYGFSLGTMIGLYYCKLYKNIFSKIILHSPYINNDFNDYIELIKNIINKRNNGFGTLSIAGLSLTLNIRPYGISKPLISHLLKLHSKNKINFKNIYKLNRLENATSRYIISEHVCYMISYIYDWFLTYNISNYKYDTPTLILCSNTYTNNITIDLNKPNFNIPQAENVSNPYDTIQKAPYIFSNYKLNLYDNALHDIFYSEKEVRDKAISDLFEFL